MTTLTVWRFPTEFGAEQTMSRLGVRGADLFDDAAIVTWPIERTKPRMRQLCGPADEGALDGSFWSLLFGLIFFLPLVTTTARPADGALRDAGIGDAFVTSARRAIKPGTSALFLLADDAVLDRAWDAARAGGERITAELTEEHESMLRRVFIRDTASPAGGQDLTPAG